MNTEIGAHAPPRYSAAPSTRASDALAKLTLGLLFGLTLLYPLVVAAAAFCLWCCPLATSAAVSLVLSSLWWAGGPSPSIGSSAVIESWRSYFGLRVWRETPAAGAGHKAVLFVAVPHGLFPLGLPLLSGPVYESVFPELTAGGPPRAAVASVFFWLPVLAPLVTWLGGVPANRESLRATLAAGQSCFLFPDGIAGAYQVPASDGREVVRIAGRNGFEAVARALGVPIVPVYYFGHSQLWTRTWPHAHHWLATLARRLRMALIWYWPVLPAHETGINIVFGAPLKEGERFADAVAALYSRYQGRMHGYESRPLLIAQ